MWVRCRAWSTKSRLRKGDLATRMWQDQSWPTAIIPWWCNNASIDSGRNVWEDYLYLQTSIDWLIYQVNFTCFLQRLVYFTNLYQEYVECSMWNLKGSASTSSQSSNVEQIMPGCSIGKLPYPCQNKIHVSRQQLLAVQKVVWCQRLLPDKVATLMANPYMCPPFTPRANGTIHYSS